MLEEFLKAIPVFLASMVKFILGPTIGFASGLHFITAVLATIAGMMTTVIAFTYFGDWLRTYLLSRYFQNRKKFTPASRRMTSVWSKYGLTGVAFLTPLFLTPLGGTLVAISSGSPKEKIIFFMLVSASAWSVIFCSVIYFFGSDYFPEFMKWMFDNLPPQF
ncbi:MAG: hypothetical protein JNK10_01650 [Cyclobacteriaceae bacterium]|nr:hypothetical protein [Cyclobacteriaceae bacterium]